MSKILKNTFKLVSIVGLVAGLSVSSANAGGLFGDGGLIRGDVGKILNPIENKVLTPIAQEATVAGAAAVGTYLGGELGGVIGAQAGNCINQAFAGKDCAGGNMKAHRPQQMPNRQPAQFGAPGGFQNGGGFPAPQFNPAFNTQAFGNFCMTQFGVFGPGPVNPVGMPCHTFIGGQVVFGNVVQM